ncbi:MAG: leucine-rich repeat domain-containing protein [Bacteroidales bacterium]|nr:leucine-rich repeat domain-containing protein [Clostridium sp.]MCM1202691.1 leucine-rich repeat domain-containing protein [Bacteroidales bacterium]
MGNKRKSIGYFQGMILFSLLLAACFALPAQAQGVEDALPFTEESAFVIDAQTGIITGYNENPEEPAEEVIIPAAVGGVAVKGLSGTFKDKVNIKRVIVPDTITTLGDDTFNGCTALSAVCVYHPETGETKEELESKLENEWESVQWNRYIVSGDGENQTFYAVTSKGNCVIIPAGVQTIGERVFNSCGFCSFDVMEGNTFFKDSNESGVNLEEGVGACLMSADGKKLYRLASGFRDYQNSLEYSLPEGIEEIYPYAIHKSGLQRVEVPTTVTQIDEYAFYESGLLGITFAEESHVAKIGAWAFAYNANLDIILPPSVTSIESYCFAYITNRTPDISKTKITTLPAYTFEGCPNLHTITMPATLLSIEAYAFAGNANLNEVIFLGDRLEKIGTGAFKDCQNMHVIDIPEGVTAIENDTFSGCQNLNTVKLPDSLKTIGDNAFSNCQNIHEMVIPPNVNYISNSTFSGVAPERLKGIDTSKNPYAQTRVKKELPKKGEKFTVGVLTYQITKSHKTKGTVTVLKPKNRKQKKITIPAKVNINGYNFNVTAVSNKAFKANKKLKTVVIGANVKTIGKEAFLNCKVLKKITVSSKKITKVNKNAFKGINRKAKIKLPKMSNKKFKKYKKKFLNKGQAATVKITK